MARAWCDDQLFGDYTLSLMDRLAFVVSSRCARLSMVTASSEKVDFHSPVAEGDLIEFVGRVLQVTSEEKAELARLRREVRRSGRSWQKPRPGSRHVALRTVFSARDSPETWYRWCRELGA